MRISDWSSDVCSSDRMHKGRLSAVGTPDEVKRLMQGSLIEVRAAEPRRSATLLREQLEVESVGLFGDRVHVVAQHPDTAMAKAGEILRNAGLAVQSIRTKIGRAHV